MAYTEFSYLYRCAANYKTHGSIVLSGEITPSLKGRVLSVIDDGQFFNPEQVGLESVFPFDESTFDEALDHGWHEVGGFDVLANKPRHEPLMSIEELVAKFEAVGKRGWSGARFGG